MEKKALHFDINSEIYNDVRPGYPQEIYKTISKYRIFDKNSRILEVGAGNGIASQEIYNRWQPKMVLIDPGENLCNIVNSKFQNNKDIDIKNQFFEKYESEYLFDAIISATAFHWLDLTTKYQKSYNLLKDNGLLILFWNNYGIENIEIGEKIQKVYSKYGNGENDAKSLYKRQLEKIEGKRKEIEESKIFNIIEHKIIKNVLEYSTEKYIKLLKTYPDHAKMGEGFFQEIAKIIEGNENRIELRIITNLEIAEKKL